MCYWLLETTKFTAGKLIAAAEARNLGVSEQGKLICNRTQTAQ